MGGASPALNQINPSSSMTHVRSFAAAGFRLGLFAAGLALLPISGHAQSAEALMFDGGPFWSAVARGIKSQNQDVTLTTPPVVSAAVQIRYLQNFAHSGVRVVLFDPVWPEQTTDAVAALVAGGVKVVTLDNELPPSVPHVYVGHNKPEMIKHASEQLAASLGDHAEVGILRIPNQRRFTDREQHAIEAIRSAHPDAKIHLDIFGADDPAQAMAQATLLLQKYPHTQTVLTTSTPLSIAMLKALRATGRVGSVRLIAYGAALPPEIADAIADGSLSLWVAQNPFELGRHASAVATELAAGRKVDATNYVDTLFVTKENLHDPAVAALNR